MAVAVRMLFKQQSTSEQATATFKHRNAWETGTGLQSKGEIAVTMNHDSDSDSNSNSKVAIKILIINHSAQLGGMVVALQRGQGWKQESGINTSCLGDVMTLAVAVTTQHDSSNMIWLLQKK